MDALVALVKTLGPTPEPEQPDFDAPTEVWMAYYDSFTKHEDSLNERFYKIPPFDNFYGCYTCGAVVVDREVHTHE